MKTRRSSNNETFYQKMLNGDENRCERFLESKKIITFSISYKLDTHLKRLNDDIWKHYHDHVEV